MTQGALTHASLKAKQRALRDGFPETMGLRVHRAISWIGRAEREAHDPDAAFVFLWIAFNAAYADETLFHDRPSSERGVFKDYFERLIALDRDNRIYAAIWQRFSGPIRLLMANRYLFNPFWEHHNCIDGYADWPERFDKASRAFASALQAGDTARILSFLFDRLYVLRNQLVHGGATWGGSVNRAQVGDGARILGFLMPVVVDLMMDNPDADWGRPFYPVVAEG